MASFDGGKVARKDGDFVGSIEGHMGGTDGLLGLDSDGIQTGVEIECVAGIAISRVLPAAFEATKAGLSTDRSSSAPRMQ